MSKRSVRHETFVIERTYPAPPARVFQAFASPASKAAWFVGPDEWIKDKHTLDFRVGGSERVAGGPEQGTVHRFDAVYREIVPDQRIVYTYEMHMDDTLTSVSVATVELRPDGAGTTMTFTESGAFLDGTDDVRSRERGTRDLLEKLARSLQKGA